jgi:hypothetical protein
MLIRKGKHIHSRSTHRHNNSSIVNRHQQQGAMSTETGVMKTETQ